ncbi:MAG: GlsB/YeaQ/YmgE family stress response membrane protein [Candidatus Pacebacteria bacterium CG_4_10_14_0_8_um_filter_42_14]|nr:MAG: GlsB/YeaQ/YmgE family stress response membrane protein [Candidatus Pacebacteria bacterium CG_4_10_14_0_8_um_filter_42_14]
MGIILWIIFGAIAGFIASSIMKSSSTLSWDVIMGIIGAVVGGFLMGMVGKTGVDGFNLYSFGVAVLGACVTIYVGRQIRSNRM